MKIKELRHIEKVRTYHWGEDLYVVIKGITHAKTTKDGHVLKTLDEKFHVIPSGWMHLEIDSVEFNA